MGSYEDRDRTEKKERPTVGVNEIFVGESRFTRKATRVCLPLCME
jgi:hypothetical protein